VERDPPCLALCHRPRHHRCPLVRPAVLRADGKERGIIATTPVRCAIYTRKSSDEGLDQAFNSLDAQHEACAAYIASQRHEGWKLVRERFDDGGVSGGTMARPALQRLLAEIDASRIGMVVVYKIDRLTRSLADFVRLVERLEAKGCSFVSVTQAFNTSTSMGRLTLNVLLSFAQFEREVTAERIRDKILASKKKGLWMGGSAPLGYDRHPYPQRRELVVNEAEAGTVRTLFRLYADLGNLHALEREVLRLGLRPKPVPPESRRRQPGAFTRGQLRYLLRNETYHGMIRHHKEAWPGLHPAIIDAALWQRVQARTAEARSQPKARPCRPNHRPLRGRIFDETGQVLTPTHTLSHGKRKTYYSSRRRIGDAPDLTGCSLPAPAAEQAIRQVLAAHLREAATTHRLLAEPEASLLPAIAARVRALADAADGQDGNLLAFVARAELGPGTITITLDATARPPRSRRA
jgi:site-specific DNA recombinase